MNRLSSLDVTNNLDLGNVQGRFGELAPQIDKVRAGLLVVSRLIELSHQIQL